MESPLQGRVWLVCLADMARTFEYVLHFVRCVTVTVSPNQIIIVTQTKESDQSLGSIDSM